MKINKISDDKHVLIIGCGRLGSSIANTLSNRNKNVTIIDIREESFRKLSPSFGGLSLEGNATDVEVLKEAGINKADVVIIVTDNDNVNIMIAQMAKKYLISTR
ncbi:MAG: NAD-binding protein [Lachnospiraceae bacterium]|nr:NAD-binding protein [Lachnospiraceae bacterium]